MHKIIVHFFLVLVLVLSALDATQNNAVPPVNQPHQPVDNNTINTPINLVTDNGQGAQLNKTHEVANAAQPQKLNQSNPLLQKKLKHSTRSRHRLNKKHAQRIIQENDPLLTRFPILTDMKYFSYKDYNGRDVSVKTLIDFNCPFIMHMSYENPKQVFDFLCLIILVEKSLQGIDVELLDPRTQEEMAYAQITIYLRKYGYIKDFLNFQESDTPWNVMPAGIICRMAEDVKKSIFNETDHIRDVFDPTIKSNIP